MLEIIVLLLVGLSPKEALSQTANTKIVVASYYGHECPGKMANGKKFDPKALTMAHPSLPLGTKVRVTNLSGKWETAVVTVTDRGPFVKGRGADVSKEVAKRLHFEKAGKCFLLIEIID